MRTAAIKPKHALMLGALWQVGTRWVMRGIGFLNTIVMARVLAPQDYGVVALAMLFVGTVQALVDFGPGMALLRKEEVTRAEIDSAWTLMVLQSLSCAALLFCLSQPAVWYFHDPRLAPVMLTMSGCFAIVSAYNIGPTLALKQYNFAVDFKIGVISKVSSVLATIASGFLLRDYRALVIGIATGYVVGTAFSYILHPYRPRWCTEHLRELWNFGKWITFGNVGSYVLSRGDELVAGKISTTAEFGLFHVGSDFGQAPVSEVGPGMLRALLPVLSSLKGDDKRANEAIIKTMSAVNTIVWPMGMGTASLALSFTLLLLGDQWRGAAGYIAWFSLMAILRTIANPLKSLLTLHGIMKTQGTAVWLEFLVFGVTALLLVPRFALEGLIFAKAIGAAAAFFFLLLISHQRVGLPIGSALIAIARPMIGSLIMFYLVRLATSGLQPGAHQILVGVPLGAAFFFAWSYLTWWLSGKPEGMESTLLDRIHGKA